MRNIWTVFKTDIRTLSRCFFACVVVVAIALLPSLYAWLNIYSNWDPYGNTGGISIAVASLDEGYTDEDGVYENKGQDVVDDLREATSINWVIVDTEEQAKGGVESGDYYAAVVIDKEFSRNMFRMLTDWTGKPAITYYENAKKNAVATKITDTAVETLKRSISENYLEVVIGGIMEQGNLLAEDLTADDPESAVKGVLYQAQDLLNACGNMMDAFEKAGSSGGVSEKDAAALEEAVANINKNLPDGSKLHETAAEIQTQVNAALARVERVLEGLENAIANAPQLPSAQQQLRDAAAQLEKA
ncbi:MAG: YhgE/Pip family protein, partial [Oscillospiraceae bacterium]|nr:YhgE/Pip family protein [Oscillospiraceae bacterium]